MFKPKKKKNVFHFINVCGWSVILCFSIDLISMLPSSIVMNESKTSYYVLGSRLWRSLHLFLYLNLFRTIFIYNLMKHFCLMFIYLIIWRHFESYFGRVIDSKWIWTCSLGFLSFVLDLTKLGLLALGHFEIQQMIA